MTNKKLCTACELVKNDTEFYKYKKMCKKCYINARTETKNQKKEEKMKQKGMEAEAKNIQTERLILKLKNSLEELIMKMDSIVVPLISENPTTKIDFFESLTTHSNNLIKCKEKYPFVREEIIKIKECMIGDIDVAITILKNNKITNEQLNNNLSEIVQTIDKIENINTEKDKNKSIINDNMHDIKEIKNNDNKNNDNNAEKNSDDAIIVSSIDLKPHKKRGRPTKNYN